MNERIKKLWVEALRSGKYKQGHETLHAGNKFCCLGVLCDIHASEHGLRWYLQDSPIEDSHAYIGSEALLPREVMDWADLDDDDPQCIGCEETCAGLNDIGWTFSQIADLIEAKL